MVSRDIATDVSRRQILKGLTGAAAAGVAGVSSAGTTAADHGAGEPVALQYFHEDWPTITDDLSRVSEVGIDAIWIQPPQKSRLTPGHEVRDGRGEPPFGYQPVDLLDFESVMGTEAELQTLIDTAHREGVEVYVDTVMNHMAAGMNFDNFPQFSWNDFHHQGGIPTWAYGFDPEDDRCFENGEPRDPDRIECDPELVEKGSIENLPDLKQSSEYVRTKLYNYMQKIANTGADGYRFDAAKNMPEWFFRQHANPWAENDFGGMFRVGEVFTTSVELAQQYADTGMHVFDYPLYFAIEDAFNHGDMRVLEGAGLIAQDSARAMPIVENHDTQHPDQYKLAHAFVLGAAGYPMLYNLYPDEILGDADFRNMIWVKKNLAGGSTIWRHTDANLAIFERESHLLVGLNNGSTTISQWVQTSWSDQILQDYSGTGEPIATDSEGWAYVTVPAGGWTYYAPTGESETGIQDGATYEIRNAYSGKYLDVAGWSSADGADVHQWSYHGGSNQRWTAEALDDGSYRLTPAHSGKALDVSGPSTDNGTNVHQWRWHGGDNQRWDIQSVGDGYRVSSRHSGKCLDVAGWSNADGGDVHQWEWYGNSNQRWYFEQV
ncbi:alpha-amylase domain-containing protein [Halapricum salinum]|uniref:DUF1939 domain-containing protein n=1 Tax=Halapricum salinum TaxID=1457250 RepID=A0A4D6HFP5_9EURY|nr:alpha-amylase domain-containing protein [Halapricum salinum]QCC52345.1 DUF1939 domain-containing protein [Halapricum salinum]